MECNRSIKKLAIFYALLSCSLCIVFYSIFVNFFYVKGLKMSVQHRLDLEVSAYALSYEQDHAAKLPEAANFRAVVRYDELPVHVRDSVTQDEIPVGEFMMFPATHEQPGTYSFLQSWRRPDAVIVYFVYSFNENDGSDAVHEAANANIYYVLFIGLAVFACVVVIAMITIRRLTSQIVRLNEWVQRFDRTTVEEPLEDFQYAELNGLAELYKKGMQRMVAGVQREQQFLRNASHELRTPIAVIQSNLDWMDRLGAFEYPPSVQPMRAITNALRNMKELTATLLWVSRKEIDSMPRSNVDVTALVESLIDDNVYLLEHKDVRVDHKVNALTINAHETLLRIVLSNIIRNAFQHTHTGTVEISLSGLVLTVRNDCDSANMGRDTESSGLGLMLISKMTDALGWPLEIKQDADTYMVTLMMQSHAFPVSKDT